MAVVGVGQPLVLMQGFARQKAIARNPQKKARQFAFRRYVVPSETKASLKARIALAEAAIAMRGKSFEEVIANVVTKCSGQDYGGKAIQAAKKRARYVAANSWLAKARGRVRSVSTGVSRAKPRKRRAKRKKIRSKRRKRRVKRRMR